MFSLGSTLVKCSPNVSRAGFLRSLKFSIGLWRPWKVLEFVKKLWNFITYSNFHIVNSEAMAYNLNFKVWVLLSFGLVVEGNLCCKFLRVIIELSKPRTNPSGLTFYTDLSIDQLSDENTVWRFEPLLFWTFFTLQFK